MRHLIITTFVALIVTTSACQPSGGNTADIGTVVNSRREPNPQGVPIYLIDVRYDTDQSIRTFRYLNPRPGCLINTRFPSCLFDPRTTIPRATG